MGNAEVAADRDRVRESIRRLGRVFDEQVLKASYALYQPLQARAPRAGIHLHRDLAYGEDPRQRLDVFAAEPASNAAPRPVVVYCHGGGYVGGERSPLPGLIYDNVPTFFARNRCVGVNATYRLAPAHPWPSGAQDVGRVVGWIKRHASAYGGDPQRIVLMGQSAGATHVAGWALDPAIHGAQGPGIAAAILLSGVYAPKQANDSSRALPPHRAAYFGADPARWDAMRLADKLQPGHPPLFISMAEYDPPFFSASAIELIAALLECDQRLPWIRLLRDHNHVSPALQINCAIDDLGPELLEFLACALSPAAGSSRQ